MYFKNGMPFLEYYHIQWILHTFNQIKWEYINNSLSKNTAKTINTTTWKDNIFPHQLANKVPLNKWEIILFLLTQIIFKFLLFFSCLVTLFWTKQLKIIIRLKKYFYQRNHHIISHFFVQLFAATDEAGKNRSPMNFRTIRKTFFNPNIKVGIIFINFFY